MRMRTPRSIWSAGLALLGLVAWTGCIDHQYEPRWEQSLDVVGPFDAQGAAVYVNRTLRQVVRLDPTRRGDALSLQVSRAPTGRSPAVIERGVDGRALFVLDDQDRTLTIYALDGGLQAKTVRLQSAYDRITLDPEGDYALLSFTGVQRQGVIARNLNEVAILDLRVAQLTPVYATLPSRAKSLLYSPAFTLDGQVQRVVAALSDAEVTLLDLLATREEDRLREIPLTLNASELPPAPTQALFDVGQASSQGQVSLYVLTQRGQDVTQINIQAAASPERKLELSVNQLAAGPAPRRMALLELGQQGRRLMVLGGDLPGFTLVDPRSGESATFALPMDRTPQQLLPYSATRQVDGQLVPELRVLVYSDQTPLMALVRPETIALDSDEPTLGRSVEAIRLEAAPQSVRLDEAGARDRAVIFHSGLLGGFTVLNLRTNRDIPIQGHSLEAVTFSGAYAYGVFRGTRHMGVFELSTGSPAVFDLPAQGRGIWVDEAEGLILVQHADEREGGFTVLDAQEPTPAKALVLSDVFVDRLFEQEISR